MSGTDLFNSAENQTELARRIDEYESGRSVCSERDAKSESTRYRIWYEHAARHLRGAKILMEHDGGNDLVAFHCQQAMEKQLKGWLLKTTGELEDGHSLVYLCRKAIQAGAPIGNRLRDCAYVNQFYIETRYPSDFYIPVSDKEALDCVEAAELLLKELQ